MSRIADTDYPAAEEAGTGTVRAVERAVAILRCFTVRNPALSVAQIQGAAGLSRPTVYRLLETLEGLNMVHAEGNPQRYRLAHGVMQLARVWLAGLNLPDVAQPIVEAVRDDTGETSALFVPRNDMRLCVLEYRSHEVLAMSRGVGDMGHLAEGASGKAILAFMGEGRQAALVGSKSDEAARERLTADLEHTRRDGFAVSRGEVFSGAVAVAAPIFDQSGAVAGSLGVFGPESRMTDKHIKEATQRVMAAAAEISALLGAQQQTAVSASKPGSRR